MPHLPGVASLLAVVATPPRRVTLSFHGAKTSSLPPLYLMTKLHHVVSPSQVKTEALNLHHHHHPPSLNSPTPTLYCYKKVISTLITLPTTQLCLHFTSSLARASSSKPHPLSSFPFTVVPRPSSLRTMTPTVTN
jgi:hypothetical protein